MGDVALGAMDGKGGMGGRCPWLVSGLVRLMDDDGRDGVTAGISDGKKLDRLRRGEGEGGI